MFAGGRRRSSNNVRAMQLFHELKQQFPTIPDHVVSAYIANHAGKPAEAEERRPALQDLLDAAVAAEDELMGRPSAPEPAPTLPEPPTDEMDHTDSDINRNVVQPSSASDPVCAGKGSFSAKRPDSLDIRNVVAGFDQTGGSGRQIQPSGRCSDIHKLLNSEAVNNKPPRSPLSGAKKFPTSKCKVEPIASPDTAKRLVNPDTAANVKKTDQKRETADTPTQTTDTLLGPPSPPNGLNLSFNLNCSMDVVQSPTRPKCSTALHIVPQRPWCQEAPAQRSYTSVNLTLRPPGAEPQAPIDITSQNSSLTYSTSSFDSQKGLASRLQITVGPNGTGVSSLRTRPRSSYHPDTGIQEINPIRAGSLPDLAGNVNPSVIIKQQARIEKLKIELCTEKTRLVAMQQEISALEGAQGGQNTTVRKLETNLEQQLLKEIKHLRGQCERLTLEVDRESESRVPLGETNVEFYRHIYTGQRFPTTQQQRSNFRPDRDLEEHWNCHMCTFQNHVLLDKCEQCEMPRILHGRPNPDPLAAFRMVRPVGQSGPFSPNQLFGASSASSGYGTQNSRLSDALDKLFGPKKTEPISSDLTHSQSADSIPGPELTYNFNRNLSVPNHLVAPSNPNSPLLLENYPSGSNPDQQEFAHDGQSNKFVNKTKTCT